MNKSILTALCFLLVACSSAPPRYLVSPTPIVNIDSTIASEIDIHAGDVSVRLQNLTHKLLQLQYRITWYNKDGVTQLENWDQPINWAHVTLAEEEQVSIHLSKPTVDSHNYRIYIMGK